MNVKVKVSKLVRDFMRMPATLRVGMRVVGAAAVLLIGHVIGTAASNGLRRVIAGERERELRNDVALSVLGRLVYATAMVVAVTIVLRGFGIETSSILALIGACGFAIGMAMQGCLSDVAAGITLSITRVFAIGDFIQVNEASGSVVAFNILQTTLQENEGSMLVVVPNRYIYENVIVNHTRLPKRSMLLRVTVSNENLSLGNVMEHVKKTVEAYPRVLKDPPVTVSIGRVYNGGTEMEVRFGMHAKDYPNANNFNYASGIMTAIREALVQTGTTLPSCMAAASA
jgi:small conductance mechanosensitive channel